MKPKSAKQDVIFGIVLMGTTGLLIGYFLNSPVLMMIAGVLGILIGSLVGWLGGRRFLVIICFGVAGGGFWGSQSGDKDILIMAAGSGGAIAGFIAAQMELFLKKP